MFACRKLSLRGPREYDLFPVEPGDCTVLESFDQMVRACLPDVVPGTQVDALAHPSTDTVQASVMPRVAPDRSSVRLDAGARVVYLRHKAATRDLGWGDFEVVGFAPIEMFGVIPYDRYSGPTSVLLHVDEAQRCPGVDGDAARFATDTAVLGTWTVTPPDGPQAKHELISPYRRVAAEPRFRGARRLGSRLQSSGVVGPRRSADRRQPVTRSCAGTALARDPRRCRAGVTRGRRARRRRGRSNSARPLRRP